ncbi:MAG: ABC transporter permease, partial [Comamonas sp.]
MQRRHFLAALPLCSVPWVHAQNKSLTPLKFTLDFRVTSQTAP